MARASGEKLAKRKSKQRRKNKSWKLWMKIVLASIMIVINILALIIGIKSYDIITTLVTDANKIKSDISIDDFELGSNIHIYDNKGEEILSVNQEKNVEYSYYDQIPEPIFNCFIAIEDRRFYEHEGVDIKSLMRAALALIKNDGEITQGGSTITQQLVKLTYLTTEQSYERKIKEMLIAIDLENKFDKQDILEFYVNNVYFSNNTYGIGSASKLYFGVEPKDLTLSQSAYLCAIPNNPVVNNPFIQDENGDNINTLKRRDLIIDAMLTCNMITDEEALQAKEEKITISKSGNSSNFDTRKDYVTKEAVQILMRESGFKFEYKFSDDAELQNYIQKYNESYKENLNRFYRKGYLIYTSFDEELQKEVQAKIDSDFAGNQEKSNENIYSLQVASVTVENSTGLIKSMIGGRTSPEKDYINRAFGVQRQNGSTMKPIAIYGPAMDNLNYVPSTMLDDTKEADGPKNAGGYYGKLTLREALRISSNTAAHKVYRDVTPAVGLGYLQNMEFANIVPADMNLASGLGGLTIGTNPREMAAAYATIANKGKFNPANCIVKMIDRNGKVVYEHKNSDTQIYKEETADMLTDVLKDVAVKGTGVGSVFNNSIEIAGKTGTTDDTKDGWFVGYSPKYTTAVWTGYDIPKVMYYSNSTKPVSIWRDIMAITHKNDSNLKFEISDAVKFVWVDAEGKEVPEGFTGATREIFPKNYTLQKNEKAFSGGIRADFIKRIEDNMVAPNNNPRDVLIANTAIANGKLLINEINSNAILSEEDKKQLVSLINYDIKQLESRITDITNPPKNVIINGSADANNKDSNNKIPDKKPDK